MAVNVIFDDDCADDVDAGVTFGVLHKLADFGEINLLATFANSNNALAAAAMRIFNTYYGRPGLLVAANKTAYPTCPYSAGCNGSAWLPGLIGTFAPTDNGSTYGDAVAAYRTVLAAQPNGSVTIVETGFMTNLAGLLASSADGISGMTGAQLVQAKVTQLVVMGGAYPSGTEYNFANCPAQTATVLSTWTSQNGYCPIYFVSFADGSPLAGPPAFARNTVNPALKAFQLYGTNQRGTWDSHAVLFAARGFSHGGTTYWTDSGDGTNTMNAGTGANSWSNSVQSGHHYLINALSDAGFAAILDGYANAGLAGMPPKSLSGSLLQ